MASMTCPFCGSSHVEYDEVDIGVGMIQCGPAGCAECNSFQFRPGEDTSFATPEEVTVQWWKGIVLATGHEAV